MKRIVLLLTLMLPAAVPAADPRPFLQDAQLGVLLATVKLPPTLSKDLVSGLSNRVLVQITVKQNSHELARAAVGIDVKYDLWDETFTLLTTAGDNLTEPRVYRSIDETVAALSQVSLPALFKPSAAWSKQPLVVSAEVLFNPIEREQMDELRKWVTENSGPVRNRAGREVSLPADALSESRAWFNRIFSQYAAGAGIAAAWRDHGSSAPFMLQDLASETH